MEYKLVKYITYAFHAGRHVASRRETQLALARTLCTVEPPNRGHFGNAVFVLSSEVVLFSEVV